MNNMKRMHIGALLNSSRDFSIVSIIIGKSESRRIMSSENGERYVSTFTLRDSESDSINLTYWTTSDLAEMLDSQFSIGSVVEISGTRLVRKGFGSSTEKYSPSTTSPFELKSIEGKTVMVECVGANLQHLLSIPSKDSSRYLNIIDILECKQLASSCVDMLVCVKHLGDVKIFQNKDGKERKLRTIKLMDQSSQQGIDLKLWDENLIRMSESWIQRKTILFLADVKVGYDDFKEINCVTTISKTIITVNPDSNTANSLKQYCESVNVSSSSRLQTLIENIVPDSVKKVTNIYSLNLETQMIVQEKDSLLVCHVYGYISGLNPEIDDDMISLNILQCGLCTTSYRKFEDVESPCCANSKCEEYMCQANNRHVIQNYKLNVDISDETGTLINCNLHLPALERILGMKVEDLIGYDGMTRTDFKWEMFLCPLRISMAVLLPTVDKRTPIFTVINVQEAGLQEICSLMPSPVID